jgi:hypothetical protein
VSETTTVPQAAVPQFTMGTGASSLPDGSYYARLLGISPVPEKTVNGEVWKAGWEFVFEIVTGPHKGSRKTVINRNPVPTDKNGLGRTVAGLLGRMPAPGEPVNLGGCVGRTYLLVVQGGKVTGLSEPPQQ